MGGCPLIRACSLIRSNMVYGLAKFCETAIEIFIKVALRRLITFHQLCDMPPRFAQRGIRIIIQDTDCLVSYTSTKKTSLAKVCDFLIGNLIFC